MTVSRNRITRNLWEFGVLLSILLGGATTVQWLTSQFAPPVSELLVGVLMGGMAITGAGWLIRIGPEIEETRQRYVGAFGAALGGLLSSLPGDDEAVTALGVILVAMLFARYSRRFVTEM